MIFEWNESKRIENWERRKVDFAEAVAIFNDPALIESLDDRDDYGEERVQALGQSEGVFYLVVWRRASRHHGLECRGKWQKAISGAIRSTKSTP
ncbi:MAG: BrnT family toxin [Rhodomicrobium sp.]